MCTTMANNKTLVISQSMSWIKRKYEIQGTYYHQNKVKKKGKKKKTNSGEFI